MLVLLHASQLAISRVFSTTCEIALCYSELSPDKGSYTLVVWYISVEQGKTFKPCYNMTGDLRCQQSVTKQLWTFVPVLVSFTQVIREST